jgi:hypothetical protein
MEVSGQPFIFPDEAAGAHRIWGCVGPRAGLSAVEKKSILDFQLSSPSARGVFIIWKNKFVYLRNVDNTAHIYVVTSPPAPKE